ncbi:MAG: TonB-dependent receptor [Abditibacteriales bacterium]|nr:TonB-dependent receptor [Abditibacteriales bacterium]MDW8367765.1 hypothetical protein [Abditibacteriales bacterium]
MKLRTIVVSVVVSSLLMGAQAFAHNTVFGPTGLILNPTAGVIGRGQYSTQLAYYREEPTSFELRAWSLNVATGITDRLELAVGVQDAKVDLTPGGTFFDMTGISGGLKYQVQAESGNSPAMALGVVMSNVAKQAGVYAVWSKSLVSKGSGQNGENDWRVHAGVRYDDVDARRSVTGSDETKVTVFGGIEAPIANRWHFMGEFNSRHKALSTTPFSASLHYRASENTQIFAGIGRIGFSSDTGWFVGINHGFGR